ncbi:resolvase [Erysipelothrix anatis]|uniref:resolvase n=1 Tax=Erysipelothrix anatis TaxID=2683713 RepID=UPI00135921CD|nr:resolvase [Erysipelothrix anatis]
MENIKNKVIGYIFDSDDMYDKKHYFEDTPENIANFIMQNCFHNCTITDTADKLILTSVVGGYVDQCPNQEYLENELLPLLIPLQLGDVEPQEINFDETDYCYEQVMQ